MVPSQISIYAADPQSESVQHLLKRLPHSQIVERIEDVTSEADALVVLIQAADLPRVTSLTQALIAAATQAGIAQLIWIAPACSDGNLGKQLDEAEACVNASSLKTIALRHAPLFSELLHHKKELKFRRILALPLGDRALPWLAPETIAEVCDHWLSGKRTAPPILAGVPLTGQEMAITLSTALKQTVNSHTFAQQRFAAIDSDRSEQIDRDELLPYLFQLGYSEAEAQTILEAADTDQNGAIDFAEFLQGLENHLDKILTTVPTEVQYVNVSRSAYQYDLMANGMDETTAKSGLELLEATPSAPALADWLGHSTPTLTDWAVQHAINWVNVHIPTKKQVYECSTITR